MARSLTGPRMQSRFIDLLSSHAGDVVPNDVIRAKLRLPDDAAVRALGDETRRVMRQGGAPELPADVWGIGWKLARG